MAKPTLNDFFQDQNKHPMAEYEMRDDNVIEVELFRSTNLGDGNSSSHRANIKIWAPQKQDNGTYVEKEGNKYHWYIKASAHQNIEKYLSEDTSAKEHAEEVAIRLANTESYFQDFLNNHKGGIVDKKEV